MLDSRLTYVVAVARHSSFTAAAEAVGVTQSAITKSVADLEQQVGYPIFHRTSRGSLLTEAGREFVERAARLLEDANDLLKRPREGHDPFAGPLRIGVCPASLEWRLLEPLSTLLPRYPSIRCNVIGATFERMVQLLRSGAVDVALGFDAAFSEWPDLKREAIPAVGSTLFVRQGHPLLSKTKVTEADVVEYTFVSPSEGRPNGQRIRRIFEAEGIEWQSHVHTIDYFPLVRRIVANTDAIGVVTTAYANSSAFRARFATLDHFDNLLPPAPMCCAIRSRWPPKPAVRAFINVLRGISFDDSDIPTGNTAATE